MTDQTTQLREWLYRLGFDSVVSVGPHRMTTWTAELSGLVTPPGDGWTHWPYYSHDAIRVSHRDLLAVFEQRGSDATLRWWVRPQPFLDYVAAMRQGVA